MNKQTQFKPYLIQSETQPELTTLSLERLLNLVTEHKVVLLRGFKTLDRGQLLDYCQSQAQLLSWDFGPVMEMKADQQPKNYLFTEGDVPLHWDGAFHREPRFLFFHCLKAPIKGSGGETVFVNTEMAWQAADEELKQQWSDYSLRFQTEKLAHYGGLITRSLISIHPDTQKVILRFAEPVGEDYLNPVQVKIIGKSEEESNTILSTISHHLRKPQYVYQHEWQQDDFLLADNFSLLHGRNSFHRHSPRHLRRIQIL
ncbi:TauD/TfdA family dioxygenase [Fluoribacter dumoffii]|uniref:TauD/TfdA dioxygenase family protein n=1 Tax=Fluoribacter dumoffii TaxID=463 RepID=UPI00224399B0|nr:TauD/TfdA family dioxygenase [Fluoribacter dumoffii]MCW8387307.1 TauD/TfdA family dioxygenase [Fluoribacter dumoffii]MCW8497511.1 TauD/TfdA family dioxygenase [Fluoribacter dumoffii]